MVDLTKKGKEFYSVIKGDERYVDTSRPVPPRASKEYFPRIEDLQINLAGKNDDIIPLLLLKINADPRLFLF